MNIDKLIKAQAQQALLTELFFNVNRLELEGKALQGLRYAMQDIEQDMEQALEESSAKAALSGELAETKQPDLEAA